MNLIPIHLAVEDDLSEWLLRRILRERPVQYAVGPDYADPEALPDPKAVVLKLGEASPRRDLREGISRRDSGGTLRQGPAYNSTLAEFVDQQWELKTATAKCPSLEKTLVALTALEERKARSAQ